MRRSRKLLLGLGGLILAYPIVLLVLGMVLEVRIEQQITERLRYVLRADEVDIDDIDVGLIRGVVVVDGVKAERSGVGTAKLKIQQLRIDLAPMGAVVFDRELESVVVRGVRLEVSALGAATLRPSKTRKRQLRIETLEIHDASLHLVASSLLPDFAEAEIRIDHLLARDVEMSRALSFLEHCQTLSASFRGGSALSVGMAFQDQTLRADSSLWGAEISVPFSWPTLDPTALEFEHLVHVGRSMGLALGPEIAKRKALDSVERVFDLFE